MKAGDGRVVTAFVVQALRGEPLTVFGDGSQTRSFCFVDDLVEGIVRVLERGDHMPYNLGNPVEFTILELAREVARLVGPITLDHRALPADDPTRRKPDISRAIVDLGWSPKVPLAEGLVPVVDAVREGLRTGTLDL